MEPGDRVKMIRKEAGLTQEKFGERLGVSKVAVSKIESKINSLSDRMCRSICREFNVTKEWLLTGMGEMYMPRSTELFGLLSDEYGLDSLEIAILRDYVQLPSEVRAFVKECLTTAVKEIKQEEKTNEQDS